MADARETAARAGEVLALNIEDLEPGARRARVVSKGGATEYVYWGAGAARLLVGVLEEALRLLHPLMPFLTEEIWGRLPLADRRADSISLAPWGGVALPERPEAVAEMASLQALIGAIRDLRQQLKVPAGKKPRVIVISPSQESRA